MTRLVLKRCDWDSRNVHEIESTDSSDLSESLGQRVDTTESLKSNWTELGQRRRVSNTLRFLLSNFSVITLWRQAKNKLQGWRWITKQGGHAKLMVYPQSQIQVTNYPIGVGLNGSWSGAESIFLDVIRLETIELWIFRGAEKRVEDRFTMMVRDAWGIEASARSER